jgi:hypothetical protein
MGIHVHLAHTGDYRRRELTFTDEVTDVEETVTRVDADVVRIALQVDHLALNLIDPAHILLVSATQTFNQGRWLG